MYKFFLTICVLTALILPSAALADTVITVAGSTALAPLIQASAADYIRAGHPHLKIAVAGGGSSVGLAKVAAKKVVFGASDIVAKENSPLIDHRVAVIGFAVVVNAKAGVKNLTKTQVRDLFVGAVKNWKQVGGKDLPVVICNRPNGSGTRAVFLGTMMEGARLVDSACVEDRTEAAVARVRSTAGAASYAALSGTRNAGVVSVAIDGIKATDQNIEAEQYPIWSYEHIYTNGIPNREVQGFIDFIAANVGLLHRLGYIGTGEMKSAGIR